MKEIWEFGLVVHMILVGFVFVVILASVLVTHAKAFIYDKEADWPMFIIQENGCYDVVDDAILQLFAIGLFGTIGSLVWPITWLVLITYGCLLVARKGVRFQKVYEEHRHNKDTGAVV